MQYPDDHRPDPDALLVVAQKEEQRAGKGQLRIFLGMAPGVGKTYAMLEAARHKKAEGRDVLVGVAETHRRSETEALLKGMDILPRHVVEYKGHRLEEFDLDAALHLRPSLILVDELAHTNAPSSRHEKRWQDVVELLDNGINVWSTMNVQHMESLNDVVAQITGVHVRETVPDSLLETAESVMLVDLPPEDLLQRLEEGKVYIPQQAAWAAKNFFRKGNLTALREIALRATAQRVNTEVLVYRQGRAIRSTWPTSERILVCVGPSPSSATLVRAAKRLATGLQCPWLALYIQTAASSGQQDGAFRNLRLAEELGAETHALTGENVPEEIMVFARQQNVTKIVIGKPVRQGWKSRLQHSPVDKLIELSEEIDLYVIRGNIQGGSTERQGRKPKIAVSPWTHYAGAASIILACTGLSFLMYPYFALSNIIMVYLLGAMASALWLDRGAAIVTALLSAFVFVFCFLPPRFSFSISDMHYSLTFGVMLAVSLVMSSMAGNAKQQAKNSRELERQSAAMATLSRELASVRGTEQLFAVAQRHLYDVFQTRNTFFIPDENGILSLAAQSPGMSPMDEKDVGIAQWVLHNGKPAGQTTQTLPDSPFCFLPLQGSSGTVGVVALQVPEDGAQGNLSNPGWQRLLEIFTNQIAKSLEMGKLEDTARTAMLASQSKKLRSSLLLAVTSGLQIPLASITASAKAGMGMAEKDSQSAKLGEAVYRDALQANHLIANLTHIAGLESGSIQLNKQQVSVQSILDAALAREQTALAAHPVRMSLPPDLPLVTGDSILLEQLFVCLLENVARHTPAATPVRLSARKEAGYLVTCVADSGPGVAPGELERIFDPFYRALKEGQPQGHGLGLSLCRAITAMHGGTITAENVLGGGLQVTIKLPL